MKITNTGVFGFEHAIRGMRMPMNSHHLSDSKYEDGKYIIGEKDLNLMQRLVLAGTEHGKFMRYITVFMDIEAPLYWFKEFDTYKVSTTANSTSTMHKITSRLLDENDFEWDTNNNDTKVSVTGYRQNMLEHINNLITYHNNFAKPEEKSEIFRLIIQDLPSAFKQTRTVTLNYAVLRNIYFQRRYHKLKYEWVDTFCGWIENELPYAKELITIESK
jgi:hypothetical protein